MHQEGSRFTSLTSVGQEKAEKSSVTVRTKRDPVSRQRSAGPAHKSKVTGKERPARGSKTRKLVRKPDDTGTLDSDQRKTGSKEKEGR